MPSCKNLKLIVDLEVCKVTCPGVWLPNKGEVLIRFWLLGSTCRTASILPVFPLVFHETFLFEKLLECQRLPELHDILTKETVKAQLQQIRDGRMISLASFECSLLTLLFPEVERPGIQCSEEVALCMQPLFHFPGVLTPKLEIVTRTVIQEEISKANGRTCINKTISSNFINEARKDKPDRHDRNIRKLAIQAHSLRTPSPPRTRQKIKKPPFVVRHVDTDIFKLQDSPRSIDSSTSRSSCRSSSQDYDYEPINNRRQRSVSPIRQICKCKLANMQREHDEYIDDFSKHNERNCTVCTLYKAYFGTKYSKHRRYNSPIRNNNTRPYSCTILEKSSNYKQRNDLMDQLSSEYDRVSLYDTCSRNKRRSSSNNRCCKIKSYDSHSSYRN